ncbi:unnamed protein product [Kuraishia capsulata CBS 1993]|uniref:General negative regulator of transcription subunit n=1 Tax=Kuraishia capsulata CBS 1993 TaxID=1382522 RepID=W6MIR2_9ASCO|nr:uncharacterized protein KUCA_T00000232001 [Kuraishia capsulata CBS 1993]CDK24272.1 unnamed protein product [Kuraishia capsulata CBS 1993]
MSQRKLQQEIDRVFKKVKEGLEAFDYVYDKLQACENQSQKEKLESDLKKEIKKLQRSRDQIKNWMGGNEVKDKKALVEHRKLIEHEMERFKEVEKIMKTKAFSKEGLNNNKIDPREKEKLECAAFVQTMIEELERQTEALEAQVDQIQATMKKGKRADNSKQEQIKEFQDVLERHNWHQERLETILRLLENGNLEADQIQTIEEDIRYYVENNQDADFAEDDEIYDELGLDEIDDSFRIAAIGHEEDDLEEDSALSTTMSGVASAPTASVSTPTMSATSSRKASVVGIAPMASVAIPPISSVPAPAVATQSPLIKSAQTAVASVAPSIIGLKPAATPLGTPKMKYATAATVNSGVSSSPVPPPGLYRTSTNLSSSSQAVPQPQSVKEVSRANTMSPMSPERGNANLKLEELTAELEIAKKRALTPAPLESIFQSLESSLLNCPDSYDSDRPRKYQPLNPRPTPIFYPQEPSIEVVNSSKILQKFETDTLFYCFYYHSRGKANGLGSSSADDYLQMNAASELVRRGWKYHPELRTWFQEDATSHNEWKLFDFKDTWAQRQNENVPFEQSSLLTSFW